MSTIMPHLLARQCFYSKIPHLVLAGLKFESNSLILPNTQQIIYGGSYMAFLLIVFWDIVSKPSRDPS